MMEDKPVTVKELNLFTKNLVDVLNTAFNHIAKRFDDIDNKLENMVLLSYRQVGLFPNRPYA